MSDNLFKNSKEELQNQIQSCLENQSYFEILYCLTAAKIHADVIEAALVNKAESITVAQTLVSALSDRLDVAGFHLKINGHENIPSLIEKFAEAERIWFYLVNQLFIHYDHNVAEIGRFRSILQAKKTQSIKKTKWGEIDESGWAQVLLEFAEDKLFGGIFEIANRALPLVLQAHLETVEALDVLVRFAWVIFEVDTSAANRSSNTSEGSLKSGVGFELELRHRIEQHVPSAVVELTPASGDQGADLIVYIEDIKIVIQAKHYSGKVGNYAVQEVHAARGYYHAHLAIVVTNSDFTKSARELAAELEVMLVYDTEIVDLLRKAALP